MLTLFVPAEAARHAQGPVCTRAPVTSLQINTQMPLAEEQPDVRTALPLGPRRRAVRVRIMAPEAPREANA
jgi:hypothetical protein